MYCEVNRGVNPDGSVVGDLDTIENFLIARVCDLLSEERLAEEWVAGRKRCYQEELKGTSWETRTHKLSCLLGLRIRSLMLELPGTVLECVCMPEHQLKFIPAVPQAKREPEDAEDALTTWLQKFATAHRRLPADSAVCRVYKEFSDMCDPELREMLLEGAGDQHPVSFRFHLALGARPLPLDFRDGTAAGEPTASQEPSQAQELAKCQQRCEELSEELAMAKAELGELRKESTCPAGEVQAGTQSKRSPLAFPPETLLDAAEFRAMLVENATYKERCEQMKLRLDRAEADLSRKTAENQRLLVESATLRERCRTVAHHPQSLREERGGAATSGGAFATMSPSGMEASSSQDSDSAERMGFMVVDDCASSVLSHSSWFSVKPHCFVTDAIFPHTQLWHRFLSDGEGTWSKALVLWLRTMRPFWKLPQHQKCSRRPLALTYKLGTQPCE